jgi:hypothetical protein
MSESMPIRLRSVRRIVLMAALAAVVPVSAFASADEAPSRIEVSVSQGKCGVAETRIVCELETSWSGVAGAEYYELSVTRADGSVQDFGRVEGTGEGGSASLRVPYVGSGTYSVTVSAYGAPRDEEDSGSKDPELLDRQSSPSGHSDDAGDRGENVAAGSGSGGGEVEAPDRERSSNGPREIGGEAPVGDSAERAPEGERAAPVTVPECEAPEAAPEQESAGPTADCTPDA